MTTDDRAHWIIDALTAWVSNSEEFAPYASMLTIDVWEDRARDGNIISWKLSLGPDRYTTANIFISNYRLSHAWEPARLLNWLEHESASSLRKLIGAAVLYGHARGLELLRETQAAIEAADEAFE